MEAASGAALLSSPGCGCEPAVLGRQNALHSPKGPALSLSAGQLWESLSPDLCVKAMCLTMSDQSCHGAFLQEQFRVSIGAGYLWKGVNILGKSVGQKPWAILCAHTISRDNIERGSFDVKPCSDASFQGKQLEFAGQIKK